MIKKTYAEDMHPKANVNYGINFKPQFDENGADTITGTPVFTIKSPIAADRPGFTVAFVSLDIDKQVVSFNPRVGTGDQGDAAYADTGVDICIECVVQTASGDTIPQEVILTVADPCL